MTASGLTLDGVKFNISTLVTGLSVRKDLNIKNSDVKVVCSGSSDAISSWEKVIIEESKVYAAGSDEPYGALTGEVVAEDAAIFGSAEVNVPFASLKDAISDGKAIKIKGTNTYAKTVYIKP